MEGFLVTFLFSYFLRVGFPLHKPYPYSLYEWGFLHFWYLKSLVILAIWWLNPWKSSLPPRFFWSKKWCWDSLCLGFKLEVWCGWKWWWWKMVMNTTVESVKNHHCNKKQIQDEWYNPSHPFILGHLEGPHNSIYNWATLHLDVPGS